MSDHTQENIYSTNNRDLQGLLPVVISITLGRDVKKRSITLSYNKMGKRIRKAGMIDDGNSFPDHYEDPAALLNFVWIEKFRNNLDLKLKVENSLANDRIHYKTNGHYDQLILNTVAGEPSHDRSIS